jgi:hypothetical protein
VGQDGRARAPAAGRRSLSTPDAVMAGKAQGGRARVRKRPEDPQKELRLYRAEHAADMARIAALVAERDSTRPSPGTGASQAVGGPPGRCAAEVDLARALAPARAAAYRARASLPVPPTPALPCSPDDVAASGGPWPPASAAPPRGTAHGARAPSPPTPVEDWFPVPTGEELEFEQVMERRASEVVWSDTTSNGRERLCKGCQERDGGGGHRNHVYYCGACLSTNQTARLFMGKGEFRGEGGKGVGPDVADGGGLPAAGGNGGPPPGGRQGR